MDIERAWRWGEALLGLGRAVYQATKDGRADRLDDILPAELLTTLERKRSELEAEVRFGGAGS